MSIECVNPRKVLDSQQVRAGRNMAIGAAQVTIPLSLAIGAAKGAIAYKTAAVAGATAGVGLGPLGVGVGLLGGVLIACMINNPKEIDKTMRTFAWFIPQFKSGDRHV